MKSSDWRDRWENGRVCFPGKRGRFQTTLPSIVVSFALNVDANDGFFSTTEATKFSGKGPSFNFAKDGQKCCSRRNGGRRQHQSGWGREGYFHCSTGKSLWNLVTHHHFTELGNQVHNYKKDDDDGKISTAQEAAAAATVSSFLKFSIQNILQRAVSGAAPTTQSTPGAEDNTSPKRRWERELNWVLLITTVSSHNSHSSANLEEDNREAAADEDAARRARLEGAPATLPIWWVDCWTHGVAIILMKGWCDQMYAINQAETFASVDKHQIPFLLCALLGAGARSLWSANNFSGLASLL